MPILDYANPLHDFLTGSLSYTATQDCWLGGCISADTANRTISIDSAQIYMGHADIGALYPVPFVHIKKRKYNYCKCKYAFTSIQGSIKNKKVHQTVHLFI